MNKSIFISAVVIGTLILVSGFLNQAQSSNPQNDNNAIIQEDLKQKEIISNLDNIAKIEGQKIKAINGSVIELENSEKIDFGSNVIKCEVGDIIENYTVANQSLVCLRKDAQGKTNSIVMPLLLSSIGGSILGNYIASKIFANSNNISRMPGSYDYRGNNGQVYNSNFQQVTTSQTTTQTSSQGSNNTSRRTFSTNRNGGLGGVFGGTVGSNGGNDSGSTGGNKSTGGLSTGSKGGISTGSKGGGGG